MKLHKYGLYDLGIGFQGIYVEYLVNPNGESFYRFIVIDGEYAGYLYNATEKGLESIVIMKKCRKYKNREIIHDM